MSNILQLRDQRVLSHFHFFVWCVVVSSHLHISCQAYDNCTMKLPFNLAICRETVNIATLAICRETVNTANLANFGDNCYFPWKGCLEWVFGTGVWNGCRVFGLKLVLCNKIAQEQWTGMMGFEIVLGILMHVLYFVEWVVYLALWVAISRSLRSSHHHITHILVSHFGFGWLLSHIDILLCLLLVRWLHEIVFYIYHSYTSLSLSLIAGICVMYIDSRLSAPIPQILPDISTIRFVASHFLSLSLSLFFMSIPCGLF